MKRKKISAREAAYLALLAFWREQKFLSDSLAEWSLLHEPSPQDFALAQEIAYGTCRLALTLDYWMHELGARGLKRKERLLLATALYQFVFLNRVPLYAIVDDTVELAKKHCHTLFAAYLNALLRRLPNFNFVLPENDLMIRFSCPEWYVNELLRDYDRDAAIACLERGNQPGKTTARVRRDVFLVIDVEGAEVKEVARNPAFYIQNATPVALCETLARHTKPPASILDLCAAPGGKLLLAHDIFPNAQLFGNDSSADRLDVLRENCQKYSLQAALTMGDGENYPGRQKFDLIILDVPCSNTGVLNKRPEARWRLDEESLQGLEKTQWRLLRRASELLSEDGCIWYLTCSILKRENEQMLLKAAEQLNLQIMADRLILPGDGFDGGFGAILETKQG